jgi:hypothetical protein
MLYLIIYDETGKIYYQTAGDVQEPSGLPFLWIEIPEGKLLKSINTEVTPHEPVFEDLPKSELDNVKEQLIAVQIALAEMMGV